ncbi:hypothetical protein [Streptomyces sp. NBC_01190]|uniref:hypothetical protein n=1 Tax=Streptomyces sp. NBC_01190 TaxID=2903767 RepID=UPI003868B1F6|nr:hypothetical protein OG519_22465 [Streptomyces sp. NBC_01190]
MARKHESAARGAAVLTALLAAGCAVGQGSPDGWRYLRSGQAAVAYPKTWRQTANGAALRGPHGRTDAALTVEAAPAAPGGSPNRAPAPRAAAEGPAPEAVPAGARASTLILDGHRARVYDYARPAPDGRPAAYAEVRVPGRDGRPLLIRAWAVDGTVRDPAVLREIVNSVEFSAERLP